jgi:radical SAM superfamily enzyme YgiQ (UPF0313 family)
MIITLKELYDHSKGDILKTAEKINNLLSDGFGTYLKIKNLKSNVFIIKNNDPIILFGVRSSDSANFGDININFLNEVFLFNDIATEELLTAFVKTGIAKKIKWSGLTRVDLVDEKIVGLAKRTGCFKLGLGIESGDSNVRERINKNFSINQIESAIKIIKKAGIKTAAFYIFGHPGETENSIHKTIDLATRLNTEAVVFNIMTPYPGTKIYEWGKQGIFGYKLNSSNWDDYDTLGGSALEIKNLPLKRLLNLQRWAYIYFYIRNLRFVSLIKFIVSKYKVIIVLLRKNRCCATSNCSSRF